MLLTLALVGVLAVIAGLLSNSLFKSKRPRLPLVGLGALAAIPYVLVTIEQHFGLNARLKATSLLGMVFLITVCYVFSSNRSKVAWRIVFVGTALQFVLGIILLNPKLGLAQPFFNGMNAIANSLLSFVKPASDMIFDLSILKDHPKAGFIILVMPGVIFFAALMRVLFHLRILSWVVSVLARFTQWALRASGAEALSQAANIFVGQTEAPLVVKPFLSKMTKAELLVIMGGGMANTAGGILIYYVNYLSGNFPGIAGHLAICTLMSLPGAFVFARLLVPETETPVTSKPLPVGKSEDVNLIDAIVKGATEGGDLAKNIVLMLIAFIGMVYLFDAVWGDLICTQLLHNVFGLDLSRFDTLHELMAWAFYPVAWLMGTPPQDCWAVASLLGEKTTLNELIAYQDLGQLLSGNSVAGIGVHELTERSKIILAYALSGFANIGSIGILVGGLGALAPERRADMAKLGVRALVVGSFATFQAAQIAAMLT